MIFIIKGFQTIVFIFIAISHNISTYMSSDLLPVFVEHRNLHETSNYVLLLNSRVAACSDSVNHNRVQELRITVLFTHLQSGLNLDLQMIVSLEV